MAASQKYSILWKLVFLYGTVRIITKWKVEEENNNCGVIDKKTGGKGRDNVGFSYKQLTESGFALYSKACGGNQSYI